MTSPTLYESVRGLPIDHLGLMIRECRQRLLRPPAGYTPDDIVRNAEALDVYAAAARDVLSMELRGMGARNG